MKLKLNTWYDTSQIWLLKREEKFSIAHKKMEEKFIGEHKVKVLTPRDGERTNYSSQFSKMSNK